MASPDRLGALHTKPWPTGTMRPSVIARCSAIAWGSSSQPAAWSCGTTSFRQVSASFILRHPAAGLAPRSRAFQAEASLLKHSFVIGVQAAD